MCSPSAAHDDIGTFRAVQPSESAIRNATTARKIARSLPARSIPASRVRCIAGRCFLCAVRRGPRRVGPVSPAGCFFAIWTFRPVEPALLPASPLNPKNSRLPWDSFKIHWHTPRTRLHSGRRAPSAKSHWQGVPEIEQKLRELYVGYVRAMQFFDDCLQQRTYLKLRLRGKTCR